MNKKEIILTGKIVSFDFGYGRIYNEDLYKRALYDYNQKIKMINRIKKLNELLNE